MMVNTLYNSMLHPPLSYKGQKFQHRAADGGGNNFMFPELGKAGLPYAKTVPGIRAAHGAKPDPGDLFDMLLSRDDEDDIKESDLGISRMLLYHADLIIHDIFRTNNKDKNISDTSSYLDLSPLYGQDREHQEMVRTMQDGLLKPNSFAEERLLAQPPGVCVYIILYNRFHNYVARQLKEVNENGKFSLVKDLPAEQAKKKLDEDIFQTARIITCGLYINIAIHDYLRCLMRKHAENTSWTLDPRLEMGLNGKKGIERGIGNQVTIEFNVLYRFHSPLSKRDAGWTKRFIQDHLTKAGLNPYDHLSDVPSDKRLSEKDFDSGSIPLEHMRPILSALNEASGTVEDKKQKKFTPDTLLLEVENSNKKSGWEFTPLIRDPKTHKFRDEDLVREMTNVLQDPICQFGSKNIPKFFRSIEILGILQSRKWEQTTLNEFREFFGLSRHKSFADINTDKEIQTKLQTVYEHPDMVELYPGLFCEGDGRCLDPGTSCPNGAGTALWRGVFSDAVTLVRSDRFYTLDWNVDTLTSWGMNEVIPDMQIFKGGVIGRLFQRAFPGYFPCDSIHLWQPFYTPAMNIVVTHDQGLLDELQDPKEIGVSKADFDAIMDVDEKLGLKRRILNDKFMNKDYGLSDADIRDLRHTQKKLLDAYYKLLFYKRPFHDSDADKNALFSKLRFKRLRHLAKYDCKISENKLKLPKAVSDFKTIQKQILAKEMKPFFKNPGYADETAIPEGPLRNVLSNGRLRDQGLKIMQKLIKKKGGGAQKMFLEYFLEMAGTIRQREQVELQTYVRKGDEDGKRRQVEQIDIIKDYAVPVMTRFAADFLGFGHLIKTDHQTGKERVYDEDKIYALFTDCQDYLTFDSDETRAFRRRKAFQSSIKELKKLAEGGVADARGWFRGNGEHTVAGDRASIRELRAFGVEVAQALFQDLKSDYSTSSSGEGSQKEMVAAVKLAVALDSLHKSVAMFAKVMQFLIRPEKDEAEPDKNKQWKRPYWKEIQRLALDGTASSIDNIMSYVLEAQRLNFDIPLIRTFTNKSNGKPLTGAPTQILVTEDTEQRDSSNGVLVQKPLTNGNVGEHSAEGQLHTLTDGETFMLEIRKASTSNGADNTIELTRSRDSYLIYGSAPGDPFTAKQLTILAITALVKYAATLDNLREAHDTMDRIKEVRTPRTGRGIGDEYRSRFMTVKWDEIVPFPTTWCLRFDKTRYGDYKKDPSRVYFVDKNGLRTEDTNCMIPIYEEWGGEGNGIAELKHGDNSQQGYGMEWTGQDETASGGGGTLVASFN